MYNYPELEHYRDIVFMFKYLATPTAENLPEVKTWMQKDARLSWAYGEKEGYIVTGFGGKVLKCSHPPPQASAPHTSASVVAPRRAHPNTRHVGIAAFCIVIPQSNAFTSLPNPCLNYLNYLNSLMHLTSTTSLV